MYGHLYFLVLFALFGSLASSPPASETRLRSIDYSCLQEAQISNETLRQYKSLTISYTYDKKIACYGLCIGMKAGRLNPDGTAKIDENIATDDSVLRTKAHKLLNKCNEKKIRGKPCKTFQRISMCIYEQVCASRDITCHDY